MVGATNLTLALAGDAIVSRRLTGLEGVEEFQTLVERVRGADVGFANLETPLHDHLGYPAAQTSGYLAAPPWVSDELVWAGVDLVSVATNHAADSGHPGIEATIEELEDHRLAYAGLGRNRTEARRPAYVETPAGRVALIAACSTMVPGSHAGRRTAEMAGRPGISPLRISTQYTVPEEQYRQLRSLSERLGLEAIKEWRQAAGIPVEDNGFTLLNADALSFTNTESFHLHFESGEEFAVERRANQVDVDAILEQIQRAKRQADWILMSLHSHEGEGARINDASIPHFLKEIAHQCVEAGADAFVGHGAHTLRGIEIYEDAPIFYGIGNFIAQIETVEPLPASMYTALGLDPQSATAADVYDALDIHEDDEYWESVLPICRLTKEGVSKIELQPVDLGVDRTRGQRGTPMAPTQECSERILRRLKRLSEPFETPIRIEDGTGQIALEEA